MILGIICKIYRLIKKKWEKNDERDKMEKREENFRTILT